MKYSEAFKALGYELISPRQDWSAEKQDGICVALWEKEIKFKNKEPWFDTRQHAGPHEGWKNKQGNTKRIRHLQRALLEFKGQIDLVIVSGDPGSGYGDATPWHPHDRQGRSWCVETVDPDTGHCVFGLSSL